MKVLFPLHLFYPSRIGGPANTIYWLCKALSRNGHDVTVVTTREGIEEGRVDIGRWVDVDGIRVRYCDSKSKFSIGVIKHALKEVKKVDTVVFSSICFLPNFLIAIAARLRGKKIIWSPRGELFDTAVQWGSKGKGLYFAVLNVLMGKQILFHATSEAEKDSILKYFPNAEVVIIPNYMELPERVGVDSDYTDLLYVGRIAPIKALEKLIDGLAQSKQFLSSRYKFVMVGGVEKQFEDYYHGLLDQVERLRLQDKVQFMGSLTGKSKFQAYASARYSFLVSNSENFGNVVIEALSQGTPVVASTGTPWSQLPEKKAGFWIQNTPKAIAETVDYLIQQSDEDYMNYRQGALNYSKEFDVFEHVDEWERIL
ncbi:MAG: glycosyltransferase family 4 protein [Bacteroidaceae bacterium]|nr:glycosyltransferase family 4 protein [Bacteroidaceae bacterium]